MACGERLWLAEANRAAAPGQASGTGESGLAVRLQLRAHNLIRLPRLMA